MSKQNIHILASKDIDKTRWDECILNSHHPMLYPMSFYLDYMADNWHGIVVNNYEAVFPVPWRMKLGIRYTYTVPFIQQLGLFGNMELANSKEIRDALFSFCRYGDYYFNTKHQFPNRSAHTNFILHLNQRHNELKEQYSSDLKNNLKKAEKHSLTYSDATIEMAVDLFQNLYAHRLRNIKSTDFNHFHKLCLFLQAKYTVIVRKITNNKNELLAVALLVNFKDRLYNLMNSITKEGREQEANPFLYDRIFYEFENSGLVFDFEGSDIKGIKDFYEKFSPINEPYYSIHFNHLPKLIKYLKR